ncbi:MAG: hypothetical protein R3C03_18630 [Pirellulaceae bacterium]
MAQAQTDSDAHSQLTRAWSLKDGSTVNATFVSYDKQTDTLILKNESDGSEVSLGLRDLESKDRGFARKLANAVRRGELTVGDGNMDSSVQTANEKVTNTVPASGKTQSLYGINWQPNMEVAQAVASGKSDSPSDDHPIMWFRVLGELDGFM